MTHDKETVATPAHLLHREVWNRGDLALVSEILVDDYTQLDSVMAEPISGSQALRARVAERRRGIPDLSRRVEQTLVDGSTVGLQYVETGTHDGALLGVEPTRRHFKIPGVFVGRVSDGRLLEGTDLWDVLGLLRQLGVTPDELDTSYNDQEP